MIAGLLRAAWSAFEGVARLCGGGASLSSICACVYCLYKMKHCSVGVWSAGIHVYTEI